MPRKPKGYVTKDKALELVDKAIRKSMKDYDKASGVPVWEGPEYLMTVNIFQSIFIFSEKANCLTLEIGSNNIREHMDPNKRKWRKPKSDERINGRCDICLWHPNTNTPRAIIEVKKKAQYSIKDLERVAGLVEDGLDFGVLCGCIWQEYPDGSKRKSIKKELEDSINDLYDKIEKSVSCHKKVKLTSKGRKPDIKKVYFDDYEPKKERKYLWTPFCCWISRLSKNT